MNTRQMGRNIHGILLLDKRLGISSNRALQEVKRLFNANKAGHTGSLDPLATGLLPICLGEATKVSGYLLHEHKRYYADIQLGIRTDTADMEGDIIEELAIPELSINLLESVFTDLTGTLNQIPPMYSALKHNGKKLYELARAGKSIDRPARPITIYELKLLDIDIDNACLQVEVHCSKGTYIRTLAEQIGSALGCCATLKALRRTHTGNLAIEQAVSIEQLQALDESTKIAQLLPVDLPLQILPAVYLNEKQALSAQQGQLLNLQNPDPGNVRIYGEDGFLGLGEIRMDGKLAPKKMFNLNS